MNVDIVSAVALWVGALIALSFLIWVVFFSPYPPGGAYSLVEAERRAEDLLRSVLPEPDYRKLRQQGYLDVPSRLLDGRVYRIPLLPGQVRVIENGRQVMMLCGVPEEWVPSADLVVMHKLMIEGNEEEYLRVCNRF